MNRLKVIPLLAAISWANLAVAQEASASDNFTYNLAGKIRLRSETFEDLYTNDGTRQREDYLRRADLELSGTLLQTMDYELELKLDREGKTTLKTAELDYRLPHNVSLALGRFDPDFGLELSGSSTWVTGIERSSIWDLAPYAGDGSEGKGLAIRHYQKHYFISAGEFDSPAGRVRDARLVYAPLQKKKHLLHLGYSYAEELEATTDGEIKSDLGIWGAGFSDNGNSSKLAKDKTAGAFAKDYAQVFELAYMYGPVSLQSEYLQRKMTGSGSQADRSASGNYAQIAYSLSGEPRDYSIKNAKFGRIKPQHKYGAWEIFYRKDWLETRGENGMLSKKRAQGLAQVDVVGVNWYSPSAFKISANYLRGKTKGIDNDVGDVAGNGLTLQVQLRF